MLKNYFQKLYIFPGGIYGQNDKNSINSRVSSTVTDRRRGESTRVGLINWECWDLRSNIMITAFNHQELTEIHVWCKILEQESEDTHVRQFSSCSPSQTVVWSSNPPTYLWYLRYHCSNFQSSNIGGSAFIPLKIYLKIFFLIKKLHIVVPGN